MTSKLTNTSLASLGRSFAAEFLVARQPTMVGPFRDQNLGTKIWRLEGGPFARDGDVGAAMRAQVSTRVVPDIDEETQFFRVRVALPDPAVPAGEIWVVFIRSPDYAAALSRAARLADVNAGLVEVSVAGTRGLAAAKVCFAH
jgi:hypothetical protein